VSHGIRWVRLDVHARESTIAVFDQATGEVSTRRVVGRPQQLLPGCSRSHRRAGRQHDVSVQLGARSDIRTGATERSARRSSTA